MQLDKSKGLFIFALTLWGWIIYSIYSNSIEGVIKTTIIQSKTPLTRVDSKIKPIKKEVLWIDKLYFDVGKELKHPIYGYLGYKKNFVIYFDSHIKSLKDQNITFAIYSDDGFRLLIDGRKIGEYPKDRPYSKSIIKTALSKGDHRIRIKYFQGYGQLGIKAEFKTDKNSFKLLGTDTNTLKFAKP
jgi:hypothetical protein